MEPPASVRSLSESPDHTSMQPVSSARSRHPDHAISTTVDSQLQRIRGSVAFLGARDEEEEFAEDLSEMMRLSGGRSDDEAADDAKREQRFSRARALIQCGMVEKGEEILRGINYDTEGTHAKLVAAETEKENGRMPRFLTKSRTAELFDTIFNANASESSSLAGDLERERMNSLRETRKEVEQKWQTSFHTTALQHTRDMWKLEHDSVDPSWSAVGGTRFLCLCLSVRLSVRLSLSLSLSLSLLSIYKCLSV